MAGRGRPRKDPSLQNNNPLAKPRSVKISIDLEVYEALVKHCDALEEALEFRPTVSQAIMHALKKAASSVK